MTEQLLAVSEEQVLWFRGRRGYIAGPGAADPAEAAYAMVGIQAQQEGPALIGLSQRTASRPDAQELTDMLRQPSGRLVRTWGQRDTLHLLDPHRHWADVVAARAQWAPGGRKGGMPSSTTLADALAAVHAAGEVVTKQVCHPSLSARYLDEVAPFAQKASMESQRFAATRVMWRLANMGHVCLVGTQGAERTYAARSLWFPQVAWPKVPDPLEAAARLTRRYLATYGPATATDVAHFFGARVGQVKDWLALLAPELVAVACGDRKGLLLLAEDQQDLLKTPPGQKDWPVRLLPLWDGLLMGHKDKSWIQPDESERKQVWRAGAYVAATVLHRGRIVATWKHKAKTRKLAVEVLPLSGWRASMLPGVKLETKIIARHLGLEEVEVKLG